MDNTTRRVVTHLPYELWYRIRLLLAGKPNSSVKAFVSAAVEAAVARAEKKAGSQGTKVA